MVWKISHFRRGPSLENKKGGATGHRHFCLFPRPDPGCGGIPAPAPRTRLPSLHRGRDSRGAGINRRLGRGNARVHREQQHENQRENQAPSGAIAFFVSHGRFLRKCPIKSGGDRHHGAAEMLVNPALSARGMTTRYGCSIGQRSPYHKHLGAGPCSTAPPRRRQTAAHRGEMHRICRSDPVCSRQPPPSPAPPAGVNCRCP